MTSRCSSPTGVLVLYHVYPNPTSEQLYLRSQKITDTDIFWIIRDIFGNIVKSVYLPAGNYQSGINIGTLPAGIYISEIRNSEKSIQTDRVLIIH